MVPEFQVWLIYGVAATGVVFTVLFLWNLVCTPFRMRNEEFLLEVAKNEALRLEVAELEELINQSSSPKNVIRSNLAAINPNILAAIDEGQVDIYVVAEESKFADVNRAADTPDGRQLLTLSVHGMDMGIDNRMRSGTPITDSIEIGTKIHFTVNPRPSLRA
jgi:hypothetical protein